MIEDEREQHGSDHPDVKLYDELSKGYSKKSSNNANKIRHCKYCRHPNHNVRSCTTRARHISDLKKRNTAWRKALLEFFEERGIGTGCILTSKYSKRYGSRMYNKGDRWILTAIEWDKITFDSSRDPEEYKVFFDSENKGENAWLESGQIDEAYRKYGGFNVKETTEVY